MYDTFVVEQIFCWWMCVLCTYMCVCVCAVYAPWLRPTSADTHATTFADASIAASTGATCAPREVRRTVAGKSRVIVRTTDSSFVTTYVRSLCWCTVARNASSWNQPCKVHTFHHVACGRPLHSSPSLLPYPAYRRVNVAARFARRAVLAVPVNTAPTKPSARRVTAIIRITRRRRPCGRLLRETERRVGHFSTHEMVCVRHVCDNSVLELLNFWSKVML